MATETVTAARALPPTARRRATTVVLVVCSAVAVASAFGPVWTVRAGLLVAVAAAVTTTVLAWREVNADRRAHAAAALAVTKAHKDILRVERSHNSAVLQVITDRNVAALAEITRQQAMVAQLRGEINALKGDRAALTARITRRESVIADLRESLVSREAELQSAREALAAAVSEAADAVAAAEAAEAARYEGSAVDENAEVHAMPRRVLLDQDEQPRRASEPDPLGNASTVIDLDSNGLDRGTERSEAPAGRRVEPVLPNYEEDRRLA